MSDLWVVRDAGHDYTALGKFNFLFTRDKYPLGDAAAFQAELGVLQPDSILVPSGPIIFNIAAALYMARLSGHCRVMVFDPRCNTYYEKDLMP